MTTNRKINITNKFIIKSNFYYILRDENFLFTIITNKKFENICKC